MSGPLACALTRCRATDGVRWYLPGPRCPEHTPSAMAGVPEPDELLARHRAALARLGEHPNPPKAYAPPEPRSGPQSPVADAEARSGP